MLDFLFANETYQFACIALAAFGASLLTFFSGFGLGTLLSPVFCLFFELELAIAMTALVHFSNNLFKISLIFRSADRKIVQSFGLGSIVGAILGALLLQNLAMLPDFTSSGLSFSPLKVLLGLLILIFVGFDIAPKAQKWTFPVSYLPLGGLLSGFVGGLSGHQGALRSMFLLKLNLEKTAYIATGAAISCMIDFSRLGVYITKWSDSFDIIPLYWLLGATLAAFAGTLCGRYFLKKMVLAYCHWLTAIMLSIISILLIFNYL